MRWGLLARHNHFIDHYWLDRSKLLELKIAIVYQTFDYGEANFLVHVTQNPHEADVWVSTVNQLGAHRGDLLWYFTNNIDEATSSIYLCSYGMSSITIHFVAAYAETCWRNTTKKRRFKF